ncbi:MAG TPA: T9SS type A sorting domain-containing protein [Candidatus Didemnitutus sp.]|nr:T9SS type A sorting domain-containing protein [Candidatus Didemnitutus sp.]
MIRSAFATLVLFFIVLAPGVLCSQDRDSTSMFGFGTLVEVTNSTIVFTDLLSSNSEPRTVIRNEQTLAFGCSFDEVRPGTNLHVDLVESAAGLVARFVQFEGCAPMIGIEGAIRSINGDTLHLNSGQPLPDGVPDVALLDDATQISDCSGRPLLRSALAVGDQIQIGGFNNGTVVVASYVVIADNCPEYKFESVELVSKRNDGITVTLENGANVDLMFGFGRPFEGDSLHAFVFSCDGRMLSWSEVEPGSILRITYLDYPNAPDVLLDAMLEAGCPKGFSGVVARVSASTVDVTESDGTTATYDFDLSTQILSCSNRELTWADILPGANVQGAWIDEGSTKKLLHLQVIDGCSYSFAAEGMVVDRTDNTITLRTWQDSTLVLTVDDRSLVIDCYGMVDRPTQLAIGDTITVYYRQERGTLYLDLAQIMNSCEQSKISGVIVSANESMMVINVGYETKVYLVNEETQLFDCAGMLIPSTSAIEGATITAHIVDRPDGYAIGSAWVDVNCAVTGIVSGPIVSYQDSVLVVSHNGEEQSVFVGDITIIMGANGAIAGRNDLLIGRNVCAIAQSIGTTSIALQIILDIDCSERGVTKGIQVQGAVESVVDGNVVITVRGQNMMFATTDITVVQHKHQGAASLSDVASGSSIVVTSERRLANGIPVAESIVILDGTSAVDNDAVTGNGVVAYPNPASDALRIEGRMQHGVDVVTVRDMQGRLVLLQRGSRSLSLQEVPVGAYLVTVQFSDAVVETLPLAIIR